MNQLKKNITFNFIGQFYTAFIGILILPLYLKSMGSEAYGLIGFFTLIQSWMQLLDLGISPTLGREVARLKGSPENTLKIRAIVRSLETVFFVIALAVTTSIFISRNWLSERWLNTSSLDHDLVSSCIGFMALMIGTRWIGSLHRSGINAYEQQVWINGLDIALATIRFPGSLLITTLSHGNILVFFAYQLAVVCCEQIFLSIKFYSLLPKTHRKVHLIDYTELKRIAPFASSIAYTAGIWVLITQIDKLLLSKTLPLEEYGYFSLIATVSGGIMLLSGPISKAILPRMTALLAQGKETEMLALYRKSTRLVVCIIAPVTLILALFPKEIIYIWTGDTKAAEWTAPILPLFILGNGLLTIGAFQYYLQYSHGKLRSHVIYNTVSATISVPLIIYATLTHGPIGAAWVWLAFRIISLAAWTPYIHFSLHPGLHKKWILKDVTYPIIISTLFPIFIKYALHQEIPSDRSSGLIFLLLTSTLTITLTTLAAFPKESRDFIREKL